MLIEAAKGGHTNVVSYLLDYPNNILSVPAPDLSQLTPPSHDTSQVRTCITLSLTRMSSFADDFDYASTCKCQNLGFSKVRFLSYPSVYLSLSLSRLLESHSKRWPWWYPLRSQTACPPPLPHPHLSQTKVRLVTNKNMSKWHYGYIYDTMVCFVRFDLYDLAFAF